MAMAAPSSDSAIKFGSRSSQGGSRAQLTEVSPEPGMGWSHGYFVPIRLLLNLLCTSPFYYPLPGRSRQT